MGFNLINSYLIEPTSFFVSFHYRTEYCRLAFIELYYSVGLFAALALVSRVRNLLDSYLDGVFCNELMEVFEPWLPLPAPPPYSILGEFIEMFWINIRFFFFCFEFSFKYGTIAVFTSL